MNDFISLTVIIPAYNAGMTIERSLISLEKQTIKLILDTQMKKKKK